MRSGCVLTYLEVVAPGPAGARAVQAVQEQTPVMSSAGAAMAVGWAGPAGHWPCWRTAPTGTAPGWACVFPGRRERTLGSVVHLPGWDRCALVWGREKNRIQRKKGKRRPG